MGNALTSAAKFGQVEIVKMLLARGADPNLKGYGYGGPESLGPLACAAECFKDKEGEEAVKVLLNAGAKVPGSGALQKAARWGYLERVKILVANGADVNEVVTRVGASALALAREHRKDDVVGFLKEHGAREEDGDVSS